MNLMSKTVILGAGVDSLSGIAMPLTSELIPQISLSLIHISEPTRPY